jgi:hypothetical protein
MNSLRRAVCFPGNPERYLRLTTNAQARYEDMMGETYFEGVARLHKASVKRVKAMLCAGLSHEPGMTLDKVGDLIDDMGLVPAMTLVSEAIKAANPEVVSGNVEGATETTTTGTPSSGSGRLGSKAAATTSNSGD